MTNRQLYDTIKSSFTKIGLVGAKALFLAYGIHNEIMQQELVRIAIGDLRTKLESDGGWRLGAYLQTYYQSVFVVNYPALSLLFKEKFYNVIITTTTLEQAYSNSHLKYMNSSNESLSDNFQHHANRRNVVINSDDTISTRQKPIASEPGKPIPIYRPLRSNKSRSNFNAGLSAMGAKLDEQCHDSNNVSSIIAKRFLFTITHFNTAKAYILLSKIVIIYTIDMRTV